MIKSLKQLNTLLAVSASVFVFYFISANHANAGFLDWFSGEEKEGGVSTSQTFDLFANFLSADNQAVKTEPKKQDLPISQNSSLVSVSSPSIAKEAVREIKNTPIKNIMTVIATAYSSTPDQTDDSPFITALGTQVRDGIVAANFLPFGTKIKLPEIYGDKIFTVEDRMNRRYWHVIDIWFPDRASAKEFGIKQVTVHILES